MGASMQAPQFDPGSFRDPDTKVFRHDGVVYRCLTADALADWNLLSSTEFFKRFTDRGLLVGTEIVPDRAGLPPLDDKWAAVLKHETIPVVSYPYEWPFGMLQDAALLQLDLTVAALDEGMTLKDATAYNIQWVGVRPTFIDIGSFTRYEPGEPWVGYRQFCEQFLYPLLLQAYRNVPFQPWLRGSLEGIGADQCRSLLSARDYLRPGVLAHVVLQANAQARYERSTRNIKSDLRAAGFGAPLIKNNLMRLRRLVEELRWEPARSTWSNYEHEHTYGEADLQQKSEVVRRALAERRASTVWDLGCNTGTYSLLASEHSDYVVALDADIVVVERLYQALRRDARTGILPLTADATDPSPGLGWRGLERRPLTDRSAPDLVLCLAVIHHLVIGRNIPLADLVEWLATLGADLVIEYVSRDDPMVERLLRHREGQRFDYSAEAFETALSRWYPTVRSETLPSGTRTLYHARRT